LFELRTLPEGEFLEIPGQRRSPREQRRRGGDLSWPVEPGMVENLLLLLT
jgi:hypothetical protein